MAPKVFTVLENNPEVMNRLAYQLGHSQDLAFHDVYSLHDPDLLALIPRPVYGLVAIIPLTDVWNKSRLDEDNSTEWYTKAGSEEPVVLVPANDKARMWIYRPAPLDLDKLLKSAIPLQMTQRANLLSESEPLYNAHEAAAKSGDTTAPDAEAADNLGQHFVAFVKADGHLWELEGTRKGPLDRGSLEESDDALSDRALELGLGRLIDLE